MAEKRTLEEILAENPQVGPLGATQPRSIDEILAEGEQRRANIDAGLTPAGLTQEEQAGGKQFFGNTLPRLVASGGAAMAVPASAGPILLPSLAAGAGDLAMQTILRIGGGPQIKPGESAEVIGGSFLTGGVLMGIIRAGGIIGGIPKEFQRRAGTSLNPFSKGEGFRLTIKSPPQEAELDLGRRIMDATRKVNDKLTAGREKKMALIRVADAQGVRIPLGRIIRTLRDELIPNAVESSAKLFNKKIIKFANDLEKIGFKTPSQMDTFINKELSEKIFSKTSGQILENRIAQAFMRARRVARDSLIDDVSPDIANLNAEIWEEMNLKEAGASLFGEGRFTPKGIFIPEKIGKEFAIENQIRSIFMAGNEAKQQYLKRIGELAGVDLHGEALRLSTKRSFNVDDRMAAGTLNRVFVLSGRPQIFKAVAKAFAPFQRLGAPAGAALEVTTDIPGGPPTRGAGKVLKFGTTVIIRPIKGRLRRQTQEEQDVDAVGELLLNLPVKKSK